MFIRNRVSWSLAMLALMSTGGLLQGCKSEGSGNEGDAGTAAINVVPQSLQTTEQAGSGQTATFAISLATKPTADVTISIASSDTSEGTVSVSSVTFTPVNWGSPQQVNVTGVDDDEADGDVTYTITTNPATSDDPNYNGVNPSDVTVKNVDNDSAGIRATDNTNLSVNESGTMAKFKVVLNTKPTANVTVPISSSDVGEVMVVNATLTFTPDNWNAPQEVTLKGVDDEEADGNQEVTISSAGATSTDTRYNGRKFDDFKVRNVDNDSAGFVIEPLTGLETTEGGGTATFTVKLITQPSGDVTLPLSSGTPLEVDIDKTSLTFTSANWASAQTVTVTGKDDNLQDGDQIFSVSTGAASSSDERYDGMNPDDVTGVNRDNDTPGFDFDDEENIVVSENGVSDTFYVRLKTRPASTVSVGVSVMTASPNPEASVSPTTLEFTIDNWASPHPVRVTGLDDNVQDGDQMFLVVLAPATGDPEYTGLDPMDVPGINEDNDSPAVRVVGNFPIEVSENGSTGTFTVGLATMPTADVTIPIMSGDIGEVTVTPMTLTFTPANWAPKTVTVKGENDDEVDGDQTVPVTIGQATSNDTVYAALPAQTVQVKNVDNDTSGVALLFDNSPRVTTEDGGQFTFWVYLRSAPTANVTFPVSVNLVGEAIPLTTSVTFTPMNWSGPQPVIIQGLDDNPAVKDGDVDYVVTVGASTSTDATYNGLSRTVALKNEDNDSAAIRVTQNILNGNTTLVTTETGGTATFRVTLRTRPTDDVVIPITSLNMAEGTTSTTSFTITPDQWNGTNTITVTGADDNPPVADGDKPYIITVGPATSNDADYNGLSGDNVNVVNLDDDAPRLVVVNPDDPNPLSVLEGDTTPKVVQVNLATAPQQPVTVDVIIDVPGEVTQDEVRVQPAQLTFTSANYAGQQQVEVFGLADIMQDGMKPFTLRFVPTSTDPAYNDPALTQTIQGENDDVDSPGVRITPLVMESSEAGGEAVFTIRLLQQPTGNVVVPLSIIQTLQYARYEGMLTNPADPDFMYNVSNPELSTDGPLPATLTFTPADYAAPKQVTVHGIDDMAADGNTDYYVRVGPLQSTDPNYGGRNMPNVKLTNIDVGDTAGILGTGLSLTNGRVNVTEGGGTISGQFKLTSRPLGQVTVNFINPNTTELTVTASRTFDSNNWNVNQQVDFVATNDAIDDGDIPVDVALSFVAPNDPAYVALTGQAQYTVPVRVVDNDDAGILVNGSGTAPVILTPVLEVPASLNGTSAPFFITLASQPTGNVFVPVASLDTGEGVLTYSGLPIPAEGISFSAADWNVPHVVMITAVNDHEIDGSPTYGVSVGPATSTDPNYQGRSGPTATAQTLEGDVASIVFDPAIVPDVVGPPRIDFHTDEGGLAKSYSLKLTSRPTSDMVLTIAITGLDTDEAIVSPTTLTFSPTNDDWAQPHTFTVTGQNDLIQDGAVDYNVSFSTLVGSDANYSGLSALSALNGRNNDDLDTAAVILPPTFTLSLFEDETTSRTIPVRLNSQPTGNVIVTATLANVPMSFVSAAATVNGATPSTGLTFTPANWNVEQIVTVAGASDGMQAGDRNIQVNFTVSGADTTYNALSPLGTNYQGTVYDRARTCRSAKLLWPGAPTNTSGVFPIDPDLDATTPTVNVYCDMQTDGGGWTLLSYAPNTNASGGLPYPGISGATVCTAACGLTPGVGIAGGAQLTALLQHSTIFAQGQSTTPITVGQPFGLLGSYTYGGYYTYDAADMATLTLGSGTGTCTELAMGTFTPQGATNIPPQAVFLAQELRAALAGDFTNSGSTYTWSVGSPMGACMLISAPPVSLLGTWQNPQYGPQVIAADGAYVMYVR